MNKWLLLAALAIAGLQLVQTQLPTRPDTRHPAADSPAASALSETKPQDTDAQLASVAFAEKRSNIQVQGEGVVVRVLADDAEGSRHQRFLLRLSSAHTVLIAHNIDLAPRVDALRAGETVSFSGEYEWNERGGVIHWTHRDPDGHHVSGWLRRNGSTYQ